MKHCRFETLKKDSIIFYTEQTEKSVYIITKGTVIVKDHSSNIEVPRTAIQMQPGDVINPGDSDGGLLKSFHFWFRCSTEIEAIALGRLEVGVSQLLRGKLSASWLAQREALVADSC